VLRLRTHDRIVVLDNCGFEFEIILADVGPTHITGTIVERRAIQGEPSVGLTLYQGLLARDKFEHVLQKGTEVGVRCFVPVITERSIVRDIRLMGCPGPGGQSLHGVLAAGVKPKAVGLWIGPEGGFSDREVDLARSAGWRPFSLGRRILRTETAAVVASGLVLYELGQLEP
jgi:16S rRNA (uracil1498-N3)-methyltransferase